MEYYFVVKNQVIDYEGLFSIQELYQTINKYFRDKGYDWREIRHHEFVNEASRFVEMELAPWRKYNDYARNEIRLYILISDIKDVIIEQDGKRMNMQRGKVHIEIDAVLMTDYESRWETTPFLYFVRIVFDKFVYKRYINRFEAILKKDTLDLISTIKSYLNLYNYRFEKEDKEKTEDIP